MLHSYVGIVIAPSDNCIMLSITLACDTGISCHDMILMIFKLIAVSKSWESAEKANAAYTGKLRGMRKTYSLNIIGLMSYSKSFAWLICLSRSNIK